MQRLEVKQLQQDLLSHQVNFMPKTIMKWSDNVYCQIIPYKDARTDMEILDQVCGCDWQKEIWQETLSKDGG